MAAKKPAGTGKRATRGKRGTSTTDVPEGASDDSGISRRRRAAQAEGQDEYRARRAAIVRVAAEVFAEKGFEGAKLADIAERFGIDRASLYYYVGSKNELFREGVEGVTDGNLAKGEEILKLPLTARERLQMLVEHLLDSYERSYPYVHVYMQQDVSQVSAVLGKEWSDQMLRKLRRLQSITVQLIAEGIDEGTFRPDMRTDLATNALFGMLNWTHRWYKPGRSTSTSDVAAAFSSIFFDGLTVRD